MLSDTKGLRSESKGFGLDFVTIKPDPLSALSAASGPAFGTYPRFRSPVFGPNLLNNAAKYTPPGGSIAVSVHEENGEVVFRVRDSGVGIPAPMLSKVFDLFTQVENSLDRSQGGLGIGLTLVREVVELHGGQVEVTSAGAGQGCEFKVRIPRAPDQPPGPDRSLAEAHETQLELEATVESCSPVA